MEEQVIIKTICEKRKDIFDIRVNNAFKNGWKMLTGPEYKMGSGSWGFVIFMYKDDDDAAE